MNFPGYAFREVIVPRSALLSSEATEIALEPATPIRGRVWFPEGVENATVYYQPLETWT